MSESVINLLIQIPLAGIVLFLTIKFLEHLEKRDTKLFETQKARDAVLFDFLQKEAETNRQFLKTQREQMNESVGRLAEEIKTLRIQIAEAKPGSTTE